MTDAQKKIKALLKAREAGKAQYAKADALLDELVDEGRLNEIIPLGKDQFARVIDQFEEKSIVWKPCGVRRYDVKVVKVRG